MNIEELTHLDYFVRIIFALIIGAIIGYERRLRNRPAGIMTNMLVCVGAALITVIQVNIKNDSLMELVKNPNLIGSIRIDPTRIVAQVVSGIGFLGAGVMFQNKDKINGITTAAILWVVAALGISCGYGYYYLALYTTMIIILFMILIKKIELYYLDKKRVIKVGIYYNWSEDSREYIERVFSDHHIDIVRRNILKEENVEDVRIRYIRYTLIVPKYAKVRVIKKELDAISWIKAVEI